MTELRTIETGPALIFDAWVAGAADAPLVLLLHGFAGSLHTWRAQLHALAAAGYRAVAPSQRGYSPGARPDPADTSNYRFEALVADAMNIAASACSGESLPSGFDPRVDAGSPPRTCASQQYGLGARRFHLVGHDWGGSIAWGIADRYPERLASLTVLSRPHPNAFSRALALPDGDQARRSRHHQAFLKPDAGPLLLADGARRLRERWQKSGVPADAIEAHLAVLGNAPAMEAALSWYRARGAIRAPLGTIRVPVLYVWGDADDTVGRAAAEGTGAFVCGPYQLEVLPGIGHFVAEEAPGRLSALLLAHLAKHPA